MTNYKKCKLLIILIGILLYSFPSLKIDAQHISNETIVTENIKDDITDNASEDVKDEGTDEKSESDNDEIIDDSDITTKIYKSTDRSLDFLDEMGSFDSPIEENILTKEDLLNKKHKSNVNNNVRTNVKLASKQSIFKPWFYIVFFLVLLIVIFELIKQRKI